MAVYLHKMTGGTSYKNCLLSRDVWVAEKPRMEYGDYGEEENLRRYGTKMPKTMDYSKIKTKFAIFGGADDVIIKPKDI